VRNAPTDIAVDDQGHVHVAYRNSSGGALHFTYQAAPGSWSNVDTNLVSDMDFGFVATPDGNMHFVYFTGSDNTTLWHTVNPNTPSEVTEAVTTTNGWGQYVDLIGTTSGQLHVVFTEGYARVRVADNTTGAWQTALVYEGGLLPEEVAIAEDLTGHPHVAYRLFDVNSYDDTYLQVASGANPIWVGERVDSSGRVGAGIDLVVAPLGPTYVSYFDWDGPEVIRVVHSEQACAEPLASGGDVNCDGLDGVDGDGDGHADDKSGGEDCDDEQGAIHPGAADPEGDGVDQDCDGADGTIVDSDGDGVPDGIDNCPDVANATQDDLDGDLQGDLCDDDADGDGEASLAGGGDDCDDQNEDIHPAAPDALPGFCEIASGGWTVSVLDGDEGAGAYHELVVDRFDHVHVLEHYFTGSAEELLYLTNASGDWGLQTLSEVEGVGAFASLAVDTAGKVHAGFYGTNRARYATTLWGDWETTTFDFGGYVGRWIDVAVDLDGHAHLAYRDDDLNVLKYSTNRGGSWQTLVVDEGAPTGMHASIAADEEGEAHVAWSGGGLLYASHDVDDPLSQWIPEVLDAEGSDPALALDPSDGSVSIRT
jgi:hypothetical protein